MIICSWDVGILHLAYCIIEYFPNQKHKFKIKEWEQINLAPQNEICCCSVNKKTKEPCEKKAKFILTSNNEETENENNNVIAYCGSHKNDHDEIVAIPCRKSKKEKNLCQYMKRGNIECGKGASYCVKTGKNKVEYYCGTHIKKTNFVLLKSIKKMGSNKVPTDVLQRRLVEKLESMPNLLSVNHMVIENQPSLKNPRMKAIACTLFDYFLIRSTIDKEKYNCNIEKLTFISPSNKLKVNEKNTIEILSRADTTEKYKLTKQLSVKYCKQLIKHDKIQYDFLLNNKKQDDLCDCFLQGCYYLEYKLQNKPTNKIKINKSIKNKIDNNNKKSNKISSKGKNAIKKNNEKNNNKSIKGKNSIKKINGNVNKKINEKNKKKINNKTIKLNL